MKTKRIFSLMGATLLALGPTVLAAGHGGGGGFGGGGHPGGGGFHAAPRAFGGGRPAYFYSRGMHFAQPSTGQFRSAGHMVPSSGRTNPRITNSATHSTQSAPLHASNSAIHSAQATQRATLNGRTDHISERHSAANWHSDWDRRHSHFFHNRFFVFDDGFWFGLDPGFFPWDYYPYYAYDYYPYDYYPGYYADVEPYYYNEGVYSDTPVQDPTVSAVQTDLTKRATSMARSMGFMARRRAMPWQNIKSPKAWM